MDNPLIIKCIELVNKYEDNYLWKYFAENPKFFDSNNNGRISEKLISNLSQNKYNSAKNFKDDLIHYFNSLEQTQQMTDLEQNSLKYLRKQINSDISSIEPLSVQQWLELWPNLYNNLIDKISKSEILSNRPQLPTINNSNMPVAIDKSKLFSLKKLIITGLDDNEKQIVFNLIKALEFPSEQDSASISIDLLNISSETYFALISYLKRVKSKKNSDILGSKR